MVLVFIVVVRIYRWMGNKRKELVWFDLVWFGWVDGAKDFREREKNGEIERIWRGRKERTNDDSQ